MADHQCTSQVFIIGGGAAGLAMAHELQRRRITTCILEKNSVGHVWTQHYDQLRLHTLKQVSGLPGLAMPDDYPNFPSAIQISEYLKSYARHFQLNVQEDVRVEHARWDANGRQWLLVGNECQYVCQTLVIATGIWSTPVASHLGDEEVFGGLITHSSQYQNPRPYVGKRVLVIGVGNSGAEIAAELAAQSVDTAVAVRSGVTFVPYPRSPLGSQGFSWLMRVLPKPVANQVLRLVHTSFPEIGLPPAQHSALDAFPVVGFQLPRAVQSKRIRVYPAVGRMIKNGVRFVDGQEVAFDAVILATGYRPTLDLLDSDVLMRDERGWPILDNHFRSTINPRVVCLGFKYPGTEGWLQSIGRFAHLAADGVVMNCRD